MSSIRKEKIRTLQPKHLSRVAGGFGHHVDTTVPLPHVEIPGAQSHTFHVTGGGVAGTECAIPQAHHFEHIDDMNELFGFGGGGGGSSYGYDASPTAAPVDSWSGTDPIPDMPGGSVPDACSKGDLEGSAATGALGGAIAGARGGVVGALVGAGTGAALGALGYGINCATHINNPTQRG